MTNINPNNDVGKINHNIKKENKVNKKEKPVAETKSVEASSLDALNSYGKASITFRGVEKKQEEVTKEQVLQRLNEVDIPDDVKKSISDNLDTPERILLAHKLLSDPKLYENQKIKTCFAEILDCTETKKNADKKIKLLDIFLSNSEINEDKIYSRIISLTLLFQENHSVDFFTNIFSSPALLNDEDTVDLLIPIFNKMNSKEHTKIFDKIFSSPKLYENKDVKNFIYYLNVDNPEETNAKIKLMDKYILEPKLQENQTIQENILDIIRYTKTEEEANAKIQVIDKFLSDPNLSKDEFIKNNISTIIQSTFSPVSAQMACNILSDEKLYGNEFIQKNIYSRIRHVETLEEVDNKIKLINLYPDVNRGIYRLTKTQEGFNLANKLLSSPLLYENKNIQEELDYIFSNSQSANFTIQIIDKYLSESNLYENDWLNANIGSILRKIKTKEQVEISNKILSEPILYKNEYVQNKIVEIIEDTQSESEVEAKIKLIDKYLSEPKLQENDWVNTNIGKFLDEIKTKEQVEILNKILSTPILYENESIKEQIDALIRFKKSPEEVDAKIKIIDKILSEPMLYENESVKEQLVEIIRFVKSPEEVDAKIKIIDKILSEPILYENENIKDDFAIFVRFTKSHEEVDAQIKVIDKFLSEPKLYKNKNLYEYISKIISNISSVSDADGKIKVIDKYLSEPMLYENENIQNNIAGIISYTNSELEAEAKIKIIDKIFSEPMLYENKNVKNNMAKIIAYTQPKENVNSKIQIIDKILSEPMLYENKDIQNSIYAIIDFTQNKENVNAKMQIIDKFLSESKLNKNQNVQNDIGKIIKNIESEENVNSKLQIIDKILLEHKLFENKDVQNNFGKIILFTRSQEIAKIKLKLIDELLNNPIFSNNNEIQNNIGSLIATINSNEKYEYAQKLFDEIINAEMTSTRAVALIETYGEIDPKKIRKLEKTVPAEVFKEITQNKNDLIISANLADLYNKNNVNEIPLIKKREILRNIVKINIDLFDVSNVVKQNFPLIPKNAEEYCTLLPSLVKSLGIETNEISAIQEKEFDNATQVLSNSLSQISDEEFVNLSITQEYSKDEFIQDVFNLVKDMKKDERQKVYDYFGFELHHNKNGTAVNDKGTKFSIAGYPVNLNNGKKLAQIDNEQTKQIIEQLRPYVIKFSENNKISCDNKEIETALNEIAKVLPEIRTFIGKTQHKTQSFDIMKHSLKVMQKVVQNPKFNEQSDSDKKILLLASLLHDSAKSEGNIDPIHAHESSFDAFYISQKFNLTKDERIKLYSLIDNHEWLADINKAQGEKREKQLKSKAFDLQYDNLFELSKIFTEADLKAVKIDDGFFDKFKDDFNVVSEQVQSLISTLKTSQPLLPVTKLPTSSKIKEAITIVNDDYSTNLKGVYVDEKGMVIIKYNEVENNTWEKIGFPKGSFSKGIEHTVKVFDHKDRRTNKPVFKDEDINTGNIHFFVHGLDYANQLSNFDAFALPDSDALLSVSYAERPESKYRFFRSQGVILNADTKYVHGGGETDAGSGCGKNIDEFKLNYAYEGSERHTDRTFVSNLIKEDLGLSTQEYMDLVNKYKDRPFTDIEPKELQEKIIKALSKINSHVRNGDRSYNEMYVSNPDVMGYFAYDWDDKVGEIKDFINNDKKVLPFIKQNAVENDMPLIVFGD